MWSSHSSDRRKEELRSRDWQSRRPQEMKAERDWEMAEKPPAGPSRVLLSTTEYSEFGFRAQGPAELGKHGRGQSFTLLSS